MQDDGGQPRSVIKLHAEMVEVLMDGGTAQASSEEHRAGVVCRTTLYQQ